MLLKTIKIDRFKRLEHVEFNLQEVNILIGGNNSGKSTIIQAVHFAFTLFLSLTISNKWPARGKNSSTVSPVDLIYIPSDDPYTLGFDGRLLEDEKRSISISFIFDDGADVGITVRKGRITNILVEPHNVELARELSTLSSPYTVFSPGLAGVSRTESYVSDGVLLRTLARGDANVVLRNILLRLNRKDDWQNFENDLAQIFPSLRIHVRYEEAVDQFIDITILDKDKNIPLDLAGTGLLQAIQILAYLHLFSPKLIILDEPDSHLHPNNQRLLCSLLSTISIERGVQVLITTHSRHVLDTMYNDATILWVREGSVAPTTLEDQADILLELGALDIREKAASENLRVIMLTEDRITQYISIILKNSGFVEAETAVLPYNGVTSIHLLKPLIRQIKEISKAGIFVHRDRDYLELDEIESWKKDIRAIGAEPFVTSEIDIEGYFCTMDYLEAVYNKVPGFDAKDILNKVVENEKDDIVASYVNGRIDYERKAGSIGKLDYGKLSVAAGKMISSDLAAYMKGKRKLAKLRQLLRTEYAISFDLNANLGLPLDKELAKSSAKYFKKKN